MSRRGDREVARELRRAATRARAGADVDVRDVPPAARAAARLAVDTGAPVADVLSRAAAVAAADAALHDAARVAAAQARFVGRCMIALPLVAVPGLGALLGLPLPAFYATRAGMAVAAVGVVLVGLGAAWTHAMQRAVHRAAAGRDHVADALELVAVGVAAGHDLPLALRLAAVEAPVRVARGLQALAFGDEVGLDVTRGGDPRLLPVDELRDVVADARVLGTPSVAVLHGLADDRRATRHARVLARAERLGALLVLPSALLLLPATLLLVGAPLVASALATARG